MGFLGEAKWPLGKTKEKRGKPPTYNLVCYLPGFWEEAKWPLGKTKKKKKREASYIQPNFASSRVLLEEAKWPLGKTKKKKRGSLLHPT